MTDITDEQRAAWQRIEQDMGEVENPEVDRADWALIAPLLPSNLTNPQPVMPTEPGIYASSDGMAWALIEDVGWTRAGSEGVLHVESARSAAPFTRLVPERPQITREQGEVAAHALWGSERTDVKDEARLFTRNDLVGLAAALVDGDDR